MATVERRPRYLLYAPFFVIMRTIDAWIALYTLPRAWREKSTGRWVSPARRDLTTGGTTVRAAVPVTGGQPGQSERATLQLSTRRRIGGTIRDEMKDMNSVRSKRDGWRTTVRQPGRSAARV